MAPTQPDLALGTTELAGARAWVLTDGKAGDENQCLAIAEALGVDAEIRRVAPRRPFAWAMPWGPIDRRDAPDISESPIAPPFPDLVIASGRRAVPYLRHVRRHSAGATYTVFLKDPRTGAGTADLIWAPVYDRVRGPNVITTLTSPHRVTAGKLRELRARPDPRLVALPGPRVAILVGGDSRHHRFTTEEIVRFAALLRALSAEGVSLMTTPSRRTPRALVEELRSIASKTGGFFWNGEGENPYLSMLALADAIVVTADSVNMISEAVATGVPVLVFEPTGGGGRLGRFLDELKLMGAIKSFGGKFERYDYVKLDSTPVIAQAVADGFAAHRAALRSG